MEPKYEYHLHTWGGFYNEEHFKIRSKISFGMEMDLWIK